MLRVMIMPAYISAESTPGMTPARNKAPTGTLAATPNRIIRILGGISEPSVPDAAITPVARPLS